MLHCKSTITSIKLFKKHCVTIALLKLPKVFY